MCSIDKSIDKVSRYYWYRDTKKYRGIRDTSIVKFWYRDISKYRQYRPSLFGSAVGHQERPSPNHHSVLLNTPPPCLVWHVYTCDKRTLFANCLFVTL